MTELDEVVHGYLSKGILAMFTIFDSPLDHPGKFVGRVFITRPGKVEPTGYIMITDTLEEMRKQTVNMHCLGREPQDEPEIVETWV